MNNNSSISSFPNIQFLLMGMEVKDTFLVHGAKIRKNVSGQWKGVNSLTKNTDIIKNLPKNASFINFACNIFNKVNLLTSD